MEGAALYNENIQTRNYKSPSSLYAYVKYSFKVRNELTGFPIYDTQSVSINCTKTGKIS